MGTLDRVFIGLAAAFLNVYKAYKKQMREFDNLKRDNPRYQDQKPLYDDEEND